jgi:hypothetical protein
MDGYLADMAEERRVLLEEAQRHGEPADVAARRADAAQDLVAERFGMEFPLGSPPPAPPADLESIRAEAKEQAEHLWRRMAALP